MGKPHFLMLAGLPAAGKTTYAEEYAYDDYRIISSDGIRKELYGDGAVQGDPGRVFALASRRIREALADGENVVFDATDLIRKNRRGILSALGKTCCHKECRLLVTPVSICRNRNVYRERSVPGHVYDKMLRSFNIPDEAEGFDKVSFEWYPERFTHPLAGAGNLNNFSQDSKWHAESLGKHGRSARDYIRTHPGFCLKSGTDAKLLEKAAKMHDIGKIFTKDYKSSKGTTDVYAHYYGHENYGAYLMLSICNWEMNGRKPMEFTPEDWIYMAKLVEWHGRAHDWQKNPKMEAKDRAFLGEKMYFDIRAIEEADSHAKVLPDPEKDPDGPAGNTAHIKGDCDEPEL